MYSNLKHVKFGNDFKGIILIDKNKFVGIIQCNVVSKYIVALEVAPEYRDMGIAKYLLKYAVNLGINKLSVNKENEIAINLYKNFGFEIFDQDNYMYYMIKI
jgi:ribosomal protein S18 acetylase RimI-like enzyme